MEEIDPTWLSGVWRNGRLTLHFSFLYRVPGFLPGTLHNQRMPVNPAQESKIHERVQATLQGSKPDRIPFIDRMDFWYRGLSYQGNVPEPYRGMSLSEIHKVIGLEQEDWMCPCAYKYRKMELVLSARGQKILHEYEPEISFFPDLWGIIPVDRAGEITTELITPFGKLVYQHRILDESIR
ncbi:MAG: hypothetical protein V1791_10385 [Pseudomonadota bacterium]